MMLNLVYRKATRYDLQQLVAMLSDDTLGASREDSTLPLNNRYVDAFKQIVDDPNNDLIVVMLSTKLVGMMQLTFIPYLTHTGSWRCLIEGVRIHADFRGQGIGEAMFHWAIKKAEEKGCQLLQLTSDKQRPDAIRFYEKLGFVASHEGFKLKL